MKKIAIRVLLNFILSLIVPFFIRLTLPDVKIPIGYDIYAVSFSLLYFLFVFKPFKKFV